MSWTFEEAKEYFKNFYQFGPMKFNQVQQVLIHNGWNVRLIQKGGACWEFIKLPETNVVNNHD